jgi:hypothetical protein
MTERQPIAIASATVPTWLTHCLNQSRIGCDWRIDRVARLAARLLGGHRGQREGRHARLTTRRDLGGQCFPSARLLRRIVVQRSEVHAHRPRRGVPHFQEPVIVVGE